MRKLGLMVSLRLSGFAGVRPPTNSGTGSDVERWSKPVTQGVYVGWRLNFGGTGTEPPRTVTKVANWTREIRPSGMRWGACGTVCQGSWTESHGENSWMNHRTL